MRQPVIVTGRRHAKAHCTGFQDCNVAGSDRSIHNARESSGLLRGEYPHHNRPHGDVAIERRAHSLVVTLATFLACRVCPSASVAAVAPPASIARHSLAMPISADDAGQLISSAAPAFQPEGTLLTRTQGASAASSYSLPDISTMLSDAQLPDPLSEMVARLQAAPEVLRPLQESLQQALQQTSPSVLPPSSAQSGSIIPDAVGEAARALSSFDVSVLAQGPASAAAAAAAATAKMLSSVPAATDAASRAAMDALSQASQTGQAGLGANSPAALTSDLAMGLANAVTGAAATLASPIVDFLTLPPVQNNPVPPADLVVGGSSVQPDGAEIVAFVQGVADGMTWAAFGSIDALGNAVASVAALVQTLSSIAAADPTASAAVVAAVVTAIAVATAASAAPAAPYPDGQYDAAAAAAYFRARPLAVAARAAEITWRSAGFVAALVIDAASGSLNSKAEQRAKQLTALLTALGPTFIKAGQSASIRSDLLPPTYITGLTALQDQVPPFSAKEAEAILDEELGEMARKRLFGSAGLPARPVAAASLGQVYKTKLLSGTPVAVKVQRPGMLDIIALDMHLIRDYGAPIGKLFGVPGDLAGTAEEWAKGFVAELDYAREAANAAQFSEDLKGTPLEGKVFAPPVVADASTKRVLTTEWVDGERLDKSSVAADVPRLCSVAMITYLQMMLGSGTLHCDPHPGNLLRTSDGKLCILDWGLVTSIAPDLQLTLIEHVAHLTAEDYDKVPGDLVRLGFVPPGGESIVRDNGVADFLSYTYSTWTSGGGAAKLDVPALFARVRELAAESPGGIFQVPPYFAYIAKSFSVLEGIGLQADPNYSIVRETLPYVSQRIILDPSPRTAGALRTFVFGGEKDDVRARVLDADRVQTLLDGVRRYAQAVAPDPASSSSSSSSSSSPSSPSSSSSASAISPSPAIDLEQAADALLDVLLSPKPTPLQDLVIEQLALIIGASSREAWDNLRKSSGQLSPRLPSTQQFAANSFSGTRAGTSASTSGTPTVSENSEIRSSRPRSVLGSIVDPFGMFRDSPIVVNDARDREALAAARKLAEVSQELLPNTASVNPQQLLRTLSQKLWARRTSLTKVSRRLAAKLLEQAVERLERRR